MASCFESRSNDDIYARLLKRNRLIHGRCRPDDCNTAMMALI
jgi:hypothetical protein